MPTAMLLTWYPGSGTCHRQATQSDEAQPRRQVPSLAFLLAVRGRCERSAVKWTDTMTLFN